MYALVDTWLPVPEVAQLAGISHKSAWQAAKTGTWHGCDLVTREIRGRGRGGKAIEVNAASLPDSLQAKLVSTAGPVLPAIPVTVPAQQREQASKAALWDRYQRAGTGQQAKAQKSLEAVQAVDRLIRSGSGRTHAVAEVSKWQGVSRGTLYRWLYSIKDVAREDWLAALLPSYAGRQSTADFSPDAWEYIKEDYLRLEAPAMSAVVDRARRLSRRDGLGWEIPTTKTVQRRMDREISHEMQVLAREGREALDRLFPAQQRDHAYFAALEAVNADGHRFDVFVRWPDGTIGRPVGVFWQDIYSAKILSYRLDETENTDAVRLAYGDLVEAYGIPEHAYLDNGRGFASKWMTGGVPTRFRFKVKDEEPLGILCQMGTEPHWTTPYHGQAKPIERAFRDLCEYVSKHPAFAGAYTGNNPTAKPENYGSRAVPFALFEQVVAEEIEAHNARLGRRSPVCAGRSFDEVFRESLAGREIRRASEHQRRLWLLAAEAVPAGRENGEISLAGNRYWSEVLVQHRGHKLVVRFDPARLHETVWLYTLAGQFIGPAECIAKAGFGDTEAARDHARQKSRWRKATRAALAAERKMHSLQRALPLEVPDPKPAEVERFPTSEPAEDEFDADAAFAAAAARLAAGSDT